MDVPSTSGRVSLAWSEIAYIQRISCWLSGPRSLKLSGCEQRQPASAARCRGRGWRPGRQPPTATPLCPPPAASASAHFHQCSTERTPPMAPAASVGYSSSPTASFTAPAPPSAAATAAPAAAARTPHSRADRRLHPPSASAVGSYSPRGAVVAGHGLSTDAPSLGGAAAAPHHRLHHPLLGDVDASDGDGDVPRFRPPPSPSPQLSLQQPRAPRANTVAQAALNRQIGECADWRALETLYRSLRNAAAAGGGGGGGAASSSSNPLGGRQLVAMARHLARLPRHRSYAKFEDERLQVFATELATATVPYLGGMAQGEYCALLWAYGKVNCHPGEDFLAALLPRLQPLLPAAGPTGLSQALWGLAHMGAPPPAPFLEAFYVALAGALRQPSANPQHVSNLLWAVVMLRLRPPEALLAQALRVLDDKLQEASPQAVALAAWAVVQVGERPPTADWWGRVHQAALRLRGRLQPQDISHLVWATARSGHPAPHKWLQAMCMEAHGCMRGFRSQELCNLLWGLVTSGFKPQDSWLTAAITAAQKLLPNFKAFELAVLLWCLASLNAKLLLPRTFPGALFFHSAPKLGFFSAQDCANVIWSLARLGLRPPEAWMAAFVEESFTQLPRFSPQHHANTLWGFAKLSRSPPEPWMDRFFLESRPLLLSFKTSEMAMIAMALGIARVEPPRQWLNQLLVASYSKLEHCSAQELCNIVWGLWRIHFRPPQRWLDAVGGAASRLVGALSATDLVTLDRAFGAFGAELPADVQGALQEVRRAREAQLQLSAGLLEGLEGEEEVRPTQQQDLQQQQQPVAVVVEVELAGKMSQQEQWERREGRQQQQQRGRRRGQLQGRREDGEVEQQPQRQPRVRGQERVALRAGGGVAGPHFERPLQGRPRTPPDAAVEGVGVPAAEAAATAPPPPPLMMMMASAVTGEEAGSAAAVEAAAAAVEALEEASAVGTGPGCTGVAAAEVASAVTAAAAVAAADARAVAGLRRPGADDPAGGAAAAVGPGEGKGRKVEAAAPVSATPAASGEQVTVGGVVVGGGVAVGAKGRRREKKRQTDRQGKRRTTHVGGASADAATAARADAAAHTVAVAAEALGSAAIAAAAPMQKAKSARVAARPPSPPPSEFVAPASLGNTAAQPLGGGSVAAAAPGSVPTGRLAVVEAGATADGSAGKVTHGSASARDVRGSAAPAAGTLGGPRPVSEIEFGSERSVESDTKAGLGDVLGAAVEPRAAAESGAREAAATALLPSRPMAGVARSAARRQARQRAVQQRSGEGADAVKERTEGMSEP